MNGIIVKSGNSDITVLGSAYTTPFSYGDNGAKTATTSAISGTQLYLTAIAMAGNSGSGSRTSTWYVEGSDDASAWTTIQTGTLTVNVGSWYGRATDVNIDLTSTTQYAYYRIRTTGLSSSGSAFSWGAIHIYGIA